VRREVEAALAAERGGDRRIARVVPAGGGCISSAARVEVEGGERAFVKGGGAGTPAGLFREEACSLAAIRETATVRVPAVLAVGDEAARPGWLLLEWLEAGRATSRTWEELGAGLARLHGRRAATAGWPHDNHIGSLPQANAARQSWPGFWRERRLEPQLRLAYDGGYFRGPERRRFAALLDDLDALLAEAAGEGFSLLHGDLWNGNVLPLTSGAPALVDPASYHGHREVDLAMAELFGGFGRDFFEAYEATWPLRPGYRPVRRAVYQLYYLLVHVNLFGGSYAAGALAALAAAGH